MNPRPQNPDPFFSSKSQFLDDEYKYVQAFLAAIPEPSTIGFLGLGALGVLVLRNKRRIGGAT
jgi:hypothetical protein